MKNLQIVNFHLTILVLNKTIYMKIIYDKWIYIHIYIQIFYNSKKVNVVNLKIVI